MRGASGTDGLLLVVAVLASGEHPKPQPSLDVTICGLGTWSIDTVPSIGQPDISIFGLMIVALSDKIDPVRIA